MSLTGHNIRRRLIDNKIATNKKEEAKNAPIVEESQKPAEEVVVQSEDKEVQIDVEKPKGRGKKQSEE